MKGVLLAGGTGSRLLPLTRVTNKHLLPVGRYPMIWYPLRALARAGVRDILVVTGTEHMGGMVAMLGSGKEHGVELTYRVQDEPGGIAQALGLAQGFAAGGPIVVHLGDNIFEDPIRTLIPSSGDLQNANVVLAYMADPRRFGVATVRGERIVAIREKPKSTTSSLAVTGLYAYPNDVFEIIRGLQPSKRGELEISDVNRTYLRQGRLSHRYTEGGWADAGTFESMERAVEIADRIRL